MGFGISIGIFVLVGLIFLLLWSRHSEKKLWNKGRCKCGGYWDRFAMDSQGGRGYGCTRCDENIWISWNVDR